MKKRIKLTQLGEKIIVLGIIGILFLGIMLFQAYIRVPQLDNQSIERSDR